MKKKILSIILALSMLCTFMPIISNAATSDVTKLVNYIKQYGTTDKNGYISYQDIETISNTTVTSSMTYRSTDNLIIFYYRFQQGNANSTLRFTYNISTQQADSNSISASYMNQSPFSIVSRTAIFDISKYTSNSTLTFIESSSDMNPPSNINELFNAQVQAAVAKWNIICEKAGTTIDKIGFTSYFGGSTPTPTPTPKPTPTPTPIVQYYPETNIPTYTYITNQILLGVANDVYCYTYNSSKFDSYINTLKTSYGFYDYYKEVSSDLVLYYLANNKYLALVGYSPTKNMVAVSFDTSLPTTTATVTKTESETAYVFEVSPEAAYGNCYVYAALYDTNGTLLTANRVPLDTTDDTSISVDKNDKATMAKIFIWAETLQPIITAEEIPLSN